MVRLTLSVRKTLEENAATYFETGKKAKRKLEGARTTIARVERELPSANASQAKRFPVRKKEWYESFRWSFTPDGTLLVGGRDAASNEVIIKKYLEPTDLVFHTDAPGSPFILLKGKPDAAAATHAMDESKLTAAQLCAAYSKAWKAGVGVADVFWVLPEQVSKTTNTGEFIGRGSFMIRGEKHFLRPPVAIAVGALSDRAACGVPAYFEGQGVSYATLAPGTEKTSDLAKKLIKKLGGTADDWVPLLPSGGCVLTGWKKTVQSKPDEAADGIADDGERTSGN